MALYPNLVKLAGTNIELFKKVESLFKDFLQRLTERAPLLCRRVTADLSLILSSWVLLPAGLAVPVIVMLTVNVTGAQGMGKHSDPMCIKSSTLTLKPETGYCSYEPETLLG